MGILILVRQSLGSIDYISLLTRFGIPYLPILVSLNVFLTLMVVIQLVLHGRNIRAATKSPSGINGLYNAIATMFIESCALITVSLLLVIGLLGAGSPTVDIFLPILTETQVRTSPRPQSSDGFSDVMTDGTGHRSATHHPSSRQQERVDKWHDHAWNHQFIQI